jgi:hypothetical protein
MEFILLNKGGKRSRPVKAWINGVSIEERGAKAIVQHRFDDEMSWVLTLP